jgi:hypothetical protein
VRDDLTEKGFSPGDIGDADVQRASVIRYAPGERNVAEYAAGQLGGRFSLLEDVGLAPGRLTVVVGTSYPAPTAGLAHGRVVALQPPTSPTSPTSPSEPPTTMPAPSINAAGTNCVN